jgi:hypothetical protein
VSHQTLYPLIEILPQGESKREGLRGLRHESRVGSGQTRQNRLWVEPFVRGPNRPDSPNRSVPWSISVIHTALGRVAATRLSTAYGDSLYSRGWIAKQLDDRPRKTLNGATPNEV